MSKRNFILLIIILVIAVIGIFVFLYSSPSTTPPTTNQGTNFVSTFNPFGNSGTTTPPAGNTMPPANVSGYQPNPVPEVNAKLKKVSGMPIAGFIVYAKERFKDITISKATEFAPSLRYVDRATGNVFQTFADQIQEKKFSATVIPQVYEAFLGSKGESVIMRYLKVDGKTIQTFTGNLPKEYLGTNVDGTAEIKGSFLPEDVKDVSLSSDAGSIFYLFNVGDNTVGTTLNLLNNKKAQIFTSAFNEWLSAWPNSKMITSTTKPASGIPGYMYAMDPSAKTLTKIFGGINGLTTLTSPNGKLVLYGNDNLSLGIYHTDTKVSDLLGVRTLPEKCVWGKASDFVYCAVPKTIDAGQYPDTWYQGEVSFADQIWKIDIKSGNATMIADPAATSGGEEIDGIKLAMDDGGNYLFFVNKRDSFLWELGLK